MEELNVTEEKVQEMEDALDDKEEYSCFFGCMNFKFGALSWIFNIL